jgi:hypothetical protein
MIFIKNQRFFVRSYDSFWGESLGEHFFTLKRVLSGENRSINKNNLQTIFFQPAVNCRGVDAEYLGGFGFVSAGLIKNGEDVFTDDIV